MEFTRYFLHIRNRDDRKNIRLEWIEQAISHPVREYVQAAKIPEAGDRYLRVVLLENGQTVHNAFFDRSFREVTDER